VSGVVSDDGGAFPDLLAAYGYDMRGEGAAVTAFHRHFHPARLGQAADAESRRRLLSLLAQRQRVA
jgi:N-acetyl-anhydromuramyl-L-alanine amidase AmpD